MVKLYIHVVTVLLDGDSDVQILDANRLPSRVVAATPPTPVLELMLKAGSVIYSEGVAAAQVFAAAKAFLEGTISAPNQYSITDHPEFMVNSISRGNLYVEPVPGSVGFGFPLCLTPESDEVEGARPIILEIPPIIELGQPRVWARFHLAVSSEEPVDPLRITAQEILDARSTPPDPSHHSREAAFEEVPKSKISRVLGWLDDVKGKGEGKDSKSLKKRGFRFERMVPGMDENDPWIRKLSGGELSSIASAMKDNSDRSVSNIPAGYAFFGQFLTHELTHDGTGGLPMRAVVELEDLEQLRSPSLDLDSLYGQGVEDNPELFDADRLHMKVSHDLPRQGGGNAAIADARNDGNLGVAQIQVAIMQLHNRVATQMYPDSPLGGKGAPPTADSSESPLDHVQAEMRRIVQAVTLYDFAKRICSPSVYAKAWGADGSFQASHWRPESSFPGMPLEFSAGAFRLGHSLIANEYSWNDTFNGASTRGKLSLARMMELTGSGGLSGRNPLPENLIIGWDRFFGFAGKAADIVQMTRKIDPYASTQMHELPLELARFGSLPKLNLVRGARLLLPPGQVIAEKMGVENILSADEMQNQDALGELLKAKGLDEQTPLWLYILREAQLQGDGNHLGELGSKIVLDTLGVLIQKTPGSILQDRTWKSIIDDKPATELQMVDLLTWRPNQPR